MKNYKLRKKRSVQNIILKTHGKNVKQHIILISYFSCRKYPTSVLEGQEALYSLALKLGKRVGAK